MDSGTDQSDVRSVIRETVCADPDVEFAVAFGSQVSGAATQSSDFDLAVSFATDRSDRERFETLCFLSGELQRDGCPFVDVSDIESLPLDVAYDAVNGEFLCGDEGAFERVKTEIEATFGTERETRRRQQRAVIDRIAEEGLRG